VFGSLGNETGLFPDPTSVATDEREEPTLLIEKISVVKYLRILAKIEANIESSNGAMKKPRMMCLVS